MRAALGHVGNPAHRPDEARRAAPVERGTDRLVAGERGGGRDGQRDDPRRHGGDQRVVEVGQQGVQATPLRGRSPSRRTPPTVCRPGPARHCGRPRGRGWWGGRSPRRRRPRRWRGGVPGPTRHRRPPGIASPSSVESSRRSCSGRSRTGITTVTSSGPNTGFPGRGRNTPALTSRRASTGSPLRSPTGAPACHRSIRAQARDETRRRRRGLPPMRTRPPSSTMVPGSTVRPKVGGRGVEARSGAEPIGAGRSGVFPAGGVHRSILTGWAPVLARGRLVA